MKKPKKLDELPSEIIAKIVSKMDMRNLFKSRSINRRFNEIILDEKNHKEFARSCVVDELKIDVVRKYGSFAQAYEQHVQFTFNNSDGTTKTITFAERKDDSKFEHLLVSVFM